MSATQRAARIVLESFVRRHGGNVEDIVQEGNSYRWTAPDGRVAEVGWE